MGTKEPDICLHYLASYDNGQTVPFKSVYGVGGPAILTYKNGQYGGGEPECNANRTFIVTFVCDSFAVPYDMKCKYIKSEYYYIVSVLFKYIIQPFI